MSWHDSIAERHPYDDGACRGGVEFKGSPVISPRRGAHHLLDAEEGAGEEGELAILVGGALHLHAAVLEEVHAVAQTSSLEHHLLVVERARRHRVRDRLQTPVPSSAMVRLAIAARVWAHIPPAAALGTKDKPSRLVIPRYTRSCILGSQLRAITLFPIQSILSHNFDWVLRRRAG